MTVQNLIPFVNPVISYLQQPMGGINTAVPTNSTEEPIKKLTSLMEELVVSINKNHNDNERFRNTYANRGNRENCSTVTCFNCHQSGHVSWDCPKRNHSRNSSQLINEGRRQGPEQGNENAERNRPTIDVPRPVFKLKSAPQGGETTEVEVPGPDKEESEDPVHKVGRKIIIKKKRTRPIEPLITSNIQPYSVMSDLQYKRADITYAQLFQVAPNIHKEILKITRPGRVVTSKMADFCLKQEESLKTTLMYCEAQEVGISIDRPSTVLMVGIHGEQKHPLGEVDEFPIIVRGKTITSKAVVSESGNYAIIVGNDWMKKARGRLDWEECELMERSDEKEREVEEYTSEEKTDLINETYFYWEFQEISKEPEVCRLCFKVGHNDETCIFRKGQSIKTAYFVNKENRKDFNIGSLKKEQELEMKNLLTEHKNLFMENTGQLGELQ
ncbi:8909_t:CDS:2 [Gigaspora margarita]|uniref:8909_t:CDS:1 n=1 Tax=Gigaspora margarita TaxID=4874 RepID=A0ABN7UXE6_GIGMA|nr:8909_t:CDS:2 [Gigaspora margarita]